jgi:hypothetical protein
MQRLARVLLETNPVKLVDYLRNKVDNENDRFINALSIILPFEDFPLMQKVNHTRRTGGKYLMYSYRYLILDNREFDVIPFESFYKKSVIFSNDDASDAFSDGEFDEIDSSDVTARY